MASVQGARPVEHFSKQEISFLRRYSLKKAVPTQKRDSCESEVILAVTSGRPKKHFFSRRKHSGKHFPMARSHVINMSIFASFSLSEEKAECVFIQGYILIMTFNYGVLWTRQRSFCPTAPTHTPHFSDLYGQNRRTRFCSYSAPGRV